MSKILVVYYSMYTHIHKMAEAVAEGVREVPGCEAIIKRVPETLSNDILGAMGALDAQKSMAHIPIATVDDLAAADAIIFGTPTRFGNMCGQMRQFLDATGQLWMNGRLGGQGGKCFYQFGNAARRAGIDHSEFPYHASSPRNGYCRSSLCLCRPDGQQRNHRWFTLRRYDHRRYQGRAVSKCQ